jgi:signal transduction histidine kinase
MAYVVEPPAQPHGAVFDSCGLTPTAVRELLDLQSAFLLLAVHELRGPLSVMSGYLSMIRDGSLGPAAGSAPLDAALITMTGSVQVMAALVDGLAAVARQDHCPDALRRQPSRLKDVVGAAITAVELEARARQVGVRQRCAEVYADVDPEQLAIALRNLISNAIRHSPSGTTVEVAVQLEETAIVIAVSDQGPGIAPEQRERIFDLFHRSRQSKGLGIGLWLVRRIVEWHGGRVTLDGASGRGSTFRIVLPWTRGLTGATA